MPLLACWMDWAIGFIGLCMGYAKKTAIIDHAKGQKAFTRSFGISLVWSIGCICTSMVIRCKGQKSIIDQGHETLRALEQLRKFFLEMKDEFLKTHLGQFVAIRDGHLVDADPDEYELVKRVYEQLGYGPIYVKKVELQEPIYRISGPRKVR